MIISIIPKTDHVIINDNKASSLFLNEFHNTMRNELFKLVTHLHVPAEAIEALVEVKRY